MKKTEQQFYDEYAEYNLKYNQLNWPSPSVEYAWLKTKKLLHQQAIQKARQLLKANRKIKIVDIGCGNGALLIRLAQELANPAIEYYGFDISHQFVEYAQAAAKTKQLTNIKFQQLDIEKKSLPIKNIDIAISSEVLEHLHKPKKFLDRVHQSLNIGGYFLLSTPNSKNMVKYPLYFIKSIAAKFHEKELKKTLTTKEEEFKLAEEEQHLFVFTYNSLKKNLQKTGFEVYATPRSTTFFGGPFFDKHRLIFAFVMMMDCLFDLLSLPQIGWNNIMFCQKS